MEKMEDSALVKDKVTLTHGEAIRAEGGALRSLQALLKEKNSSFGGLVRVQNKQKEFLWVHEEYKDQTDARLSFD